MKNKKAVMGKVISVFILILVVSILAGLTFLFVSQLKENVRDTAEIQVTVTNEIDAWLNRTGYTVDVVSTDATARNFDLTGIWNATDNTAIVAANYTFSSAGVLLNATFDYETSNVTLNYTYYSANTEPSYISVNSTESAGATIVNYLPLIFLALIFGAILTLVLKIILPYINLGRQFGEGY